MTFDYKLFCRLYYYFWYCIGYNINFLWGLVYFTRFLSMGS